MFQKFLFRSWFALFVITVCVNGVVLSGRQEFLITLNYWYAWQYSLSRLLIIYTVLAPLLWVVRYRVAWGRRKQLEHKLLVEQVDYI